MGIAAYNGFINEKNGTAKKFTELVKTTPLINGRPAATFLVSLHI
jgi:hypothetical protein